ncbi:MAG: hypothetical protein GY701_03845 [Sulfitobacter sp.]|nr:hypothetical protein [Sulfitobacter sp.]
MTVDTALDLGARHLGIGRSPEEGHVILTDPRGNEFQVDSRKHQSASIATPPVRLVAGVVSHSWAGRVPRFVDERSCSLKGPFRVGQCYRQAPTRGPATPLRGAPPDHRSSGRALRDGRGAEPRIEEPDPNHPAFG